MIMNPKRIKFLIDIDESIDKLSKDFPQEPIINKLQDKFYNLANKQFIKSAYQGLHELTVEDVLKKQASEFYKDFPQSIKKELIESFVEMEHQRRRDNYFEFCISLLRQIECVVNYYFKSYNLLSLVIRDSQSRKQLFVNTNVKAIYESGSFKKLEQAEFPHTKFGINKSGNYYFKSFINFFLPYHYQDISDIQKILSDLDKNGFKIKFNMVLYYTFFKGKANMIEFEEKENLLDEIYQQRHVVHGGKISGILQKQSDNIQLDTQETTIMDSFHNQYNNYLKYQGFLADFMQKVSNSPNLSLI